MKKRRTKKRAKKRARKSPNAAVVKELRTIVGQMRSLCSSMSEIRYLMPRREPPPLPGGATGFGGPRHLPIILPHTFFVPPGLHYPQ